MKFFLYLCILTGLFAGSPLYALQRISEYGVYVTLDPTDNQRRTNRFIRILDTRTARAVSTTITSLPRRAVQLKLDTAVTSPQLTLSKKTWKLKGILPAGLGRGPNGLKDAYIVAKHLCAVRLQSDPKLIPDWLAAGIALQTIYEFDSMNRIGMIKYPGIKAMLDHTTYLPISSIIEQQPPLSFNPGLTLYAEYSHLILSSLQRKRTWYTVFTKHLQSKQKITPDILSTLIGPRAVHEPLSFAFRSSSPAQQWFSTLCFKQVYSVRSPLPPIRTIRILLNLVEDIDGKKPLSPLFTKTLEAFFQQLEIKQKEDEKQEGKKIKDYRKQHVSEWSRRLDRLYILSNPYFRESINALAEECRRLGKQKSCADFVTAYNKVFSVHKKWEDVELMLDTHEKSVRGKHTVPLLNKIIKEQPQWKALDAYLDTFE